MSHESLNDCSCSEAPRRSRQLIADQFTSLPSSPDQTETSSSDLPGFVQFPGDASGVDYHVTDDMNVSADAGMTSAYRLHRYHIDDHRNIRFRGDVDDCRMTNPYRSSGYSYLVHPQSAATTLNPAERYNELRPSDDCCVWNQYHNADTQEPASVTEVQRHRDNDAMMIVTCSSNDRLGITKRTVEDRGLGLVETTIESTSLGLVEQTVKLAGGRLVKTTLNCRNLDLIETRLYSEDLGVLKTTLHSGQHGLLKSSRNDNCSTVLHDRTSTDCDETNTSDVWTDIFASEHENSWLTTTPETWRRCPDVDKSETLSSAGHKHHPSSSGHSGREELERQIDIRHEECSREPGNKEADRHSTTAYQFIARPSGHHTGSRDPQMSDDDWLAQATSLRYSYEHYTEEVQSNDVSSASSVLSEDDVLIIDSVECSEDEETDIDDELAEADMDLRRQPGAADAVYSCSDESQTVSCDDIISVSPDYALVKQFMVSSDSKLDEGGWYASEEEREDAVQQQPQQRTKTETEANSSEKLMSVDCQSSDSNFAHQNLLPTVEDMQDSDAGVEHCQRFAIKPCQVMLSRLQTDSSLEKDSTTNDHTTHDASLIADVSHSNQNALRTQEFGITNGEHPTGIVSNAAGLNTSSREKSLCQQETQQLPSLAPTEMVTETSINAITATGKQELPCEQMTVDEHEKSRDERNEVGSAAIHHHYMTRTGSRWKRGAFLEETRSPTQLVQRHQLTETNSHKETSKSNEETPESVGAVQQHPVMVSIRDWRGRSSPDHNTYSHTIGVIVSARSNECKSKPEDVDVSTDRPDTLTSPNDDQHRKEDWPPAAGAPQSPKRKLRKSASLRQPSADHPTWSGSLNTIMNQRRARVGVLRSAKQQASIRDKRSSDESGRSDVKRRASRKQSRTCSSNLTNETGVAANDAFADDRRKTESETESEKQVVRKRQKVRQSKHKDRELEHGVNGTGTTEAKNVSWAVTPVTEPTDQDTEDVDIEENTSTSGFSTLETEIQSQNDASNYRPTPSTVAQSDSSTETSIPRAPLIVRFRRESVDSDASVGSGHVMKQIIAEIRRVHRRLDLVLQQRRPRRQGSTCTSTGHGQRHAVVATQDASHLHRPSVNTHKDDYQPCRCNDASSEADVKLADGTVSRNTETGNWPTTLRALVKSQPLCSDDCSDSDAVQLLLNVVERCRPHVGRLLSRLTCQSTIILGTALCSGRSTTHLLLIEAELAGGVARPPLTIVLPIDNGQKSRRRRRRRLRPDQQIAASSTTASATQSAANELCTISDIQQSSQTVTPLSGTTNTLTTTLASTVTVEISDGNASRLNKLAHESLTPTIGEPQQSIDEAGSPCITSRGQHMARQTSAFVVPARRVPADNDRSSSEEKRDSAETSSRVEQRPKSVGKNRDGKTPTPHRPPWLTQTILTGGQLEDRQMSVDYTQRPPSAAAAASSVNFIQQHAMRHRPPTPLRSHDVPRDPGVSRLLPTLSLFDTELDLSDCDPRTASGSGNTDLPTPTYQCSLASACRHDDWLDSSFLDSSSSYDRHQINLAHQHALYHQNYQNSFYLPWTANTAVQRPHRPRSRQRAWWPPDFDVPSACLNSNCYNTWFPYQRPYSRSHHNHHYHQQR